MHEIELGEELLRCGGPTCVQACGVGRCSIGKSEGRAVRLVHREYRGAE